MADRTYELRAVFTATNKASRALNTIEKRIDKLQKKIDKLNGQTATVTINTVGDKQVEKVTDGIERKLAKLEKNDTTVKFKADKSKLDSTLNTARKQLTKFKNEDILVDFDANSRPMVQKAKATKTLLDRMFAKAVEAELDVTGDRQSIAKAQRVQSAISKLAKRYQFQIDYANAMQTDRKIQETAAKQKLIEKQREFNVKIKGDREVQTRINNLISSGNEWARRPYEANLQGDASQAMRTLRTTEAEFKRISQQSYRAEVVATQRNMPQVAAQANDLARRMETLNSKVATVRTRLEGLPPVLQGLAVVKRSAEGIEGTYDIKINYRSLLSAATAGMAAKAAFNSLGNSLANAAPLAEAFARKVYVGQQAVFAFTAALKLVAIGAIGPLLSGLTILTASLGAAATGFGLLALAAIPIVKAFGEQQQKAQQVESAQKSLAGSSEQVASAQRGLADAQRGVADAARSGSEGIRSAVMAQKDAIQAVGDAQRSLGQAHAGVADARKAKEESVRAAIIAVSDAYRGVQDAQRGLKDAHEAVTSARRSGEESIRSAIQAQKDAYRGVQDAQRSLADSHQAVAEARRSGEESIRSAIQAQQDAYRGVQDAQRSLADAHVGVSDARRAREEGITDALKQQRDAQRAVQDAVISLGDAHQDQARLTDATAEATQDLNRALQDEKYEIQDLRYEMEGLGLDQRELTLDIADARRELAEADNSEDRARAQIQLERLLLREKQLTDDQREAQQNLNNARKQGSDQLQSAVEARDQAWAAEVDGMRNIKDQERALADAREAAVEAEKGVSEARRDGNRQVADALRAVSDAQRGVADAQRAALEAERSVSKARQDAAKQVADAQQGVLDAQRGVADAIRAVGEAERNVTKARQDAAKQVQDAQKGVLDAQRGVADAIRAVGEAERGVIKARQDGNKQIQQAQQGVLDAQRALKDAIQGVAEADRNVTKARMDANRQMADAQRAVADAQKQLAQALKEHQTNQQKLNALMAKQPAYIQRVMDKVNQLKNAYKTAFAEANRAVGGLIVRLLDVAIRAMPKMGQTALRTANQVDNAFDNVGKNWQMFGAIKSVNRIMRFVPAITREWTEAIGNFGGAFANIMGIAMPYALRFAKVVNRAALALFKWTNSERGRKRLNDFFQAAAPVAKAIAKTFWDIAGALVSWAIDHPEKVAAGIRLLGKVALGAIRGLQRIIEIMNNIRENRPALWWLLGWATKLYIGIRLIPGPLRRILFGLGKIAAVGAGGKLAATAGSLGMLGKKSKGAGDSAQSAGKKAGKAGTTFGKYGGAAAAAGSGVFAFGNKADKGGNKAQDAGKKVSKSGGFFRKLGNMAVTAGGLMLGFGGKAGKAGSAAGKAGGKAGAAGKGFKVLQSPVAKVIGRFIVGVPIIGRIGLALAALGPVGWIIVGVIAALAATFWILWRRVDKFRNYWKGLWKELKKSEAIRELGNTLKNAFGGALKNVITVVKTAWKWLGKLWNAFTGGGENGGGGKGKTPHGAIDNTMTVINGVAKALTAVIKAIGWVNRKWLAMWKGIINAAKWAYNVLVGNSIIPDLRDKIVNIFENLPKNIGKALKGLGGIIAAPFKWGWKKASGFLSNLTGDSDKESNKAAGHIGKNSKKGAKNSNKNYKDMEDKGSKATKNLRDNVGNNTNDAEKRSTKNTKEMKERGVKNANQFEKEGSKATKNLRDNIGKNTREGENRSTKNTQKMQEKGVKNTRQFEKDGSKATKNLRDNIGKNTNEAENRSTKHTNTMQREGNRNTKEFEKKTGQNMQNAKHGMVTPIESARNLLKSIWNGILEGISRVLGAVGMKDVSKKIEGAKWAKGGTTSDPSSVQKFATGGIGTGSAKPRVHVWNEQQGNEAYIVQNRPKQEQLPYLKTAASWHGMDVVPSRQFATGGIGGGIGRKKMEEKDNGVPASYRLPHGTNPWGGYGSAPWTGTTTWNWTPEVESKIREITYKAGAGTAVNTYKGHPGGEQNSVDWWGTRGRGNQIPMSAGDRIYDYIKKNIDHSYTIWRGKFNGSKPSRGHFDHLHATLAGGGGGSIPNPMQILFEKIWGNTVGELMDGFENRMKGGHVMRQGTASGAKIVTGGIYDWIDEKIPDTLFGSSGSGSNVDAFKGAWASSKGGSPTENKSLGKAAAQEMNWNWNDLHELWMRESGWDKGAANPTSSARGIPQRMISAHPLGAGEGDWLSHAGKQIAWGINYIKNRPGYGNATGALRAHDRQGWYEKGGLTGYSEGGMARSPHLGLLGDRPGGEVMWPLGNNNATRAIVRAVQEGTNDTNVRSRTNTTATVGNRATSNRVSTDSASIVAAIEEMKREVTATLIQQLQEIEIGEDSLKTMYNAGFSTAIKALGTKKAREIIDEQVGEQINFDSILGGNK